MNFEQLTSNAGIVFATMAFHLSGKLTEDEKSQLDLGHWCLVYQHSSARSCRKSLRQIALEEIKKRASTSFSAWRRVYEFAERECPRLANFASVPMLELATSVADRAYLLEMCLVENDDNLIQELMTEAQTFDDWSSLIELEELDESQRLIVVERLFEVACSFSDYARLYAKSYIHAELEKAKQLMTFVDSDFRDWEAIEDNLQMSLIEGHVIFCQEEMRKRARTFRQKLKARKFSYSLEEPAKVLMEAANCFDHWFLVYKYARVPHIEAIAFSKALELATTKERVLRLFSLMAFEIPHVENIRIAERFAQLL